ncbi:DNA repair protein recA homolog 1, chloroplastic-like [Prunus dulcis]|uniref:DNA repair protein recA homolog 1, chloroplastic-like n=1 Tax=Prunus dulcis TaxID=3755 RepID=UPI00148282FE|nr:DNA repair protein recA homolog 1, chloroplastic-like [Prunus dulcis]
MRDMREGAICTKSLAESEKQHWLQREATLEETIKQLQKETDLHIQKEIGVYYGTPQATFGGIALKFFASVRLEICSTGKIKSVNGEEVIGVRVHVRVQKSKVILNASKWILYL